MAIETPLYMQEGIYSARQDRLVFDVLFTEGIISMGTGEFAVSQRAAGANMSVDVAAGKAVVDGDDQANQGSYFVRSTTVANVAILPADLVNPRIDLIVLRIRDSNVIGGVDNDAIVDVIEGIPAGVPAVPATPASCIPLARVAVAVGAVSIVNANITDLRAPSSSKQFTVTSGWQRVTTAERDALTPYVGQVVFNTTSNQIQTWDGATWQLAVQPPETSMVNKLLRSIAELSVATWELEAKSLAQDNGLADWHGEPFVPYDNRVASRTLDGAGFPLLGIFRDPDRDQGFVALDDYSPLQSYKGIPHINGGPVGNSGIAVSPDGKWLLGVTGTTVRVYEINSDGNVDGGTIVSTVTLASGMPQAGAFAFSPDGKAIVFALTSSPFVAAYPFNTATGVIGAVYANPAALPASAPRNVVFTPNSSYVALSLSESAAPFFTVYAINTVAATWGAKSAAPAAPPAAAVYGVQFSDAGDYFFVCGNAFVYAYAFNQGTGAIGARVDAAGTAGLFYQALYQRAGKVIALPSTTPYINGWTFAAGAWGAKWANPATLPAGGITAPNQNCITADAAAFAVCDANEGGGSSPPFYGYVLNAASFGARVNPAGRPQVSAGTVIPFPLENRGDVLQFSPTTNFALLLYGDKAGTTGLTGQLQTTTKNLAANAQTVYVLDDSTLGAGVTRQYDVSLDGGGTWTNNVTPGAYTTLGVPGNQLRVRLTITRPGLGVAGTIRWFAVWAV